MRTSSSRTLVGSLLPPTNWLPLLGAGKMPALSRACALGSRRLAGIALLGNGLPGVRPRAAYLASRPGDSWLASGTLIVELNWPLYELAEGTVWLTLPPCISLRHSIL